MFRKPHWDKAETLLNEAEVAKGHIRYLKKLSSVVSGDKNFAKFLNGELSDLKKGLVTEKNAPHQKKLISILTQAKAAKNDAMARSSLEVSMEELREIVGIKEVSAREQQSIGDRHFWPIYNLDIKNPNTAEEETHDPEKLLAKYKALLGEIDKTQSKLKAELSAALAHHLESEAKA